MSHAFTAIANLVATGCPLPATSHRPLLLAAGSWQPLRRVPVDSGEVR